MKYETVWDFPDWVKDLAKFVAVLSVLGLVIVLCFGVCYLGMWPQFFTSPASADVCYGTDYRYQQPSQACIDQRFDQCMATEKYSRSECAALVGGK